MNSIERLAKLSGITNLTESFGEKKYADYDKAGLNAVKKELQGIMALAARSSFKYKNAQEELKVVEACLKKMDEPEKKVEEGTETIITTDEVVLEKKDDDKEDKKDDSDDSDKEEKSEKKDDSDDKKDDKPDFFKKKEDDKDSDDDKKEDKKDDEKSDKKDDDKEDDKSDKDDKEDKSEKKDDEDDKNNKVEESVGNNQTSHAAQAFDNINRVTNTLSNTLHSWIDSGNKVNVETLSQQANYLKNMLQKLYNSTKDDGIKNQLNDFYKAVNPLVEFIVNSVNAGELDYKQSKKVQTQLQFIDTALDKLTSRGVTESAADIAKRILEKDLTPTEVEVDYENGPVENSGIKFEQGTKIRLPNAVRNVVNQRIKELDQAILKYDDKGYDDKSIKQQAVDCLKQILQDLSTNDLEGVKKAQIYFETLMSPLTDFFPPQLINWLANAVNPYVGVKEAFNAPVVGTITGILNIHPRDGVAVTIKNEKDNRDVLAKIPFADLIPGKPLVIATQHDTEDWEDDVAGATVIIPPEQVEWLIGKVQKENAAQ